MAFHQGSTIFHPVAEIAIKNSVDVRHFLMMDMPAYYTIDIIFMCLMHNGMLKITDIIYRVPDLMFQISCQRPIRKSHLTPDAIEVAIEHQQQIVNPISELIDNFAGLMFMQKADYGVIYIRYW